MGFVNYRITNCGKYITPDVAVSSLIYNPMPATKATIKAISIDFIMLLMLTPFTINLCAKIQTRRISSDSLLPWMNIEVVITTPIKIIIVFWIYLHCRTLKIKLRRQIKVLTWKSKHLLIHYHLIQILESKVYLKMLCSHHKNSLPTKKRYW